MNMRSPVVGTIGFPGATATNPKNMKVRTRDTEKKMIGFEVFPLIKGPFTPKVRVSLCQRCDDTCDTVLINHNGDA